MGAQLGRLVGKARRSRPGHRAGPDRAGAASDEGDRTRGGGAPRTADGQQCRDAAAGESGCSPPGSRPPARGQGGCRAAGRELVLPAPAAQHEQVVPSRGGATSARPPVIADGVSGSALPARGVSAGVRRDAARRTDAHASAPASGSSSRPSPASSSSSAPCRGAASAAVDADNLDPSTRRASSARAAGTITETAPASRRDHRGQLPPGPGRAAVSPSSPRCRTRDRVCRDQCAAAAQPGRWRGRGAALGTPRGGG